MFSGITGSSEVCSSELIDGNDSKTFLSEPTEATIVNTTHEFIKNHNSKFANYKILYGGSVKANNAKEIVSLPNVDGALIGGASLKSDDFTKIITD